MDKSRKRKICAFLQLKIENGLNSYLSVILSQREGCALYPKLILI